MIATSCSVTGVAAAPCATAAATSSSVGVATVIVLLAASLGVGGRDEAAAALLGVCACGVGGREVRFDSVTCVHDAVFGDDSNDDAACAVVLPAATAAFTTFVHGSLS